MTDGEPETVVSASLQKIKSIKNPIKKQIVIFYFIKSETSGSFVSHFDGHFAYLKTLDFYFKSRRNDFMFGTFIGRFPSDDAVSIAVKGLSIKTQHLITGNGCRDSTAALDRTLRHANFYRQQPQ